MNLATLEHPDSPQPPGDGAAPRLRMTAIVKSYGAVRAVRDGTLVVRPGTVHALVGENGAGKSTMIKILAGAEASDAGTIEVDGVEHSIQSTSDAIALGVATVYQEPQLFADLTVAENIFLGRELVRHGRVDWRAQNAQVVALLATLGLPDRFAGLLVGDLSVAEQQQISIAKALAGNAKILILDEPSAILTDAEIELLFTVVRSLVAGGLSVIYISHRLDELMKIADDVTIMRDGCTIATHTIRSTNVRRIAEEMIGGELPDMSSKRSAQPGEVRLQLEALALGKKFTGVDLSLRSGEIVGLYGLVGSGVADIASTVYGMATPTAGIIRVDGTPTRIASPEAAHARGIAYLPANRKQEGMFSFQSIAFNISIGHLGLLSRLGIWVKRSAERSIADAMIGRLAIKTPSRQQAIGAMSGGNAQKVILARQLVERPSILLLAEPTQGVDIGAREEIHRIVIELADQGTAVLVVTSDLAEAQRLCDRILVVRNGRTTVEFDGTASQLDLLAAAVGSAPADTDQARA